MGEREEKAKSDSFDDYIVYRSRLDDLLQLHGVLIHLEDSKALAERPADMIRAVHLATAGFLAGFFDRRSDSLNVFRLWRKYFPARKEDVDVLETELEPLLEKLTQLRHKAAAHADLSVAVQNAARLELGPVIQRLFDKFYAAARAFLVDEAKHSALTAEIEDWGLKRAVDEPPSWGAAKLKKYSGTNRAPGPNVAGTRAARLLPRTPLENSDLLPSHQRGGGVENRRDGCGLWACRAQFCGVRERTRDPRQAGPS